MGKTNLLGGEGTKAQRPPLFLSNDSFNFFFLQLRTETPKIDFGKFTFTDELLDINLSAPVKLDRSTTPPLSKSKSFKKRNKNKFGLPPRHSRSLPASPISPIKRMSLPLINFLKSTSFSNQESNPMQPKYSSCHLPNVSGSFDTPTPSIKDTNISIPGAAKKSLKSLPPTVTVYLICD